MTKKVKGSLAISRLVYLLARHQIRLPAIIAKYLPGGDWLADLYQGPGAASLLVEHVAQLYEEGKQLGDGTRNEAVALIADVLDETVDFEALDLDDRIKLFSQLDRMKQEDMIGFEEMSLDGEGEEDEEIPKFMSGFLPVDLVTGGLYQGILMFLANPGAGKTSLMAAMMGAVAEAAESRSTHFYQNEVPAPLMRPRLRQLRQRVKFRPTDRLICGSLGSKDILERLVNDPDPTRVVFFDCPDTTAGGQGEGRRFAIEQAYLDLIRMKALSKLVVVSSWPRRKDSQLTIESPSESWAKSWYSDMIIGISEVGNRIKLECIKNRFGPKGRIVYFDFDFSDLSWNVEGVHMDEEDDW